MQNIIKPDIAMEANSQGGVISATRKALDSGATKEEIDHAL